MNNITCSIVLFQSQASIIKQLIISITNCQIVEKLYLIDNSPTNTLQTLAIHPNIEYIFNNANLGYGAAHNIAIKKALAFSKYHIVLNPDVIFEEGTIENIYHYLEEHPDIGQLMPKITYPNGTLQYACKLLPTPADLILRRFLPAALIKKRTAYFEMHESGYNKIMEVPYLSGCFMFLRMEALQTIGLFDERFFMYPEDIDLTRRIHKHYKTIFYPYAEITHVHERGSYKSIRLLFIHIANMIKYFNKWGWFFDKERKEINKKIRAQYASK